MRFAPLALLLACNSEPGPGDVECSSSTVGPDCEAYDVCCEQLDESGAMACWFETESGQRFECDDPDCEQAAHEMVCAICDYPATSSSPCG